MSGVPSLLLRKDEIIELFNNGISPRKIAKLLNIYDQTVYNLLKYLNIDYTSKKYKRSQAKYSLNTNYFEIIDTEEKAYFLGFIVADGYISRNGYSLVISLNSIDKDILIKFLNSIGSNMNVKDFIKENKYAHSKVSVNSKEFISHLINKNIYSNKSLTMNSSVFNYVPDNLKRHFLRGYFDGDGNLCYGKKYSSGTKYSIQIIGTKEFLLDTYNKCCKTNNTLYKYKTCNMYCWKITKKSLVDDFLYYIYNDCNVYLDRKYNMACAKVKLRDMLEA